MAKHNVPIQSLIDHIKTAVDVDPWAKEMAEELLKEKEAVVLCKDCKWWGSNRLCENSDSPCFQNGCTHGNWFCADGERKEDH